MPETNHGLSFSMETVLIIRRDAQVIAMEMQNGHIERFSCEEMSRSKSMELFGVDKPVTK